MIQKSLQLASEEDFKNIPGLRWKRDSDGTVIATTVRKRLRRDHLYFHGRGRLGVYYERTTRYQARKARLAYALDRVVVEDRPGDLDGLLVFEARVRGDVPKVFLKSALRSAKTRATFHAKGLGRLLRPADGK